MSESDQPRILYSLDARTLPQQFFLHQLYNAFLSAMTTIACASVSSAHVTRSFDSCRKSPPILQHMITS
jgi:hypothetical protein